MWVDTKSIGTIRCRRVLQQVVDPAHGRGGWSTDLEGGIDRLDRLRGGVVQVEVVGLRAGPEHLQVRLVPDLEQPAGDLVAAVAIDEMADQRLDQVAPPAEIARRRDDPAVVEHRAVRVRGQVGGRERQLDDRAQPGLEQPVQRGIDRG